MYEYKEMKGVIDYIEVHLDEDMCVDMLAEMGMLSKFYFQRLFYKLVGVTVMEYVRLRRVARASEDIKDGRKITDIAFENGFNSSETFTRAFKSV
ncbi:helix-turn-helix transcriptional regulator [Vallitalea sp.]|jgi:AraC family transcriptional regulator|uniref:helix-turn-helix transcriptional regulator n=1 Tax=Vallitalea sp. TaxID=1882829 RepID=UPI0025E92DCD|nr:AraC family transcriptional regulator [Vallitalea sp.]MCT4686270.1 AraC family transcriptional regulator [Vallitalea sp.]